MEKTNDNQSQNIVKKIEENIKQRKNKYLKCVDKIGGDSNTFENDFINADRLDNIRKIEAMEDANCRAVLLRGNKGSGKTYTGIKYAIYKGYTFEEVNLFKIRNSQVSKKEIYKNLTFLDAVKYFFFSSRNLLLSSTFWITFITFIVTLTNGLVSMIQIYNCDPDITWIFLLSVALACLIFTIFILTASFRRRRKSESRMTVDPQNITENTEKKRVIIFTDNNLNSTELFDVLYNIYNYYITRKNTFIIIESTTEDIDFVKNMEKLNIPILDIKSNYEFNPKICKELVNEDIGICNSFKDIEKSFNKPIYVEHWDMHHIYYNDFSNWPSLQISHYDYLMPKTFKTICNKISNRSMLEIVRKYKSIRQNNDLNFMDYLLIQVCIKESNSSFLNYFFSDVYGFYDRSSKDNKYITWKEDSVKNIYEKTQIMEFNSDIEWWQKLLILRFYELCTSAPFNTNSMDMNEFETNVKTIVRGKKILSLDNIEDFKL